MTLVELLLYLVIAGIVGTIAQYVVGYGRGGFVVAVILGLLGALIGSWMAGRLNLPVLLPVTIGGRTIEIVWSILGSLVLIVLLSLLRGPKNWRRGYRRR